MLISILAFLLAITILIFVHEWGHFIAARLCGVKVLKFSIGFGKPFWTYVSKKTGTEWSFAWIPMGGFVKMLDEREGEVPVGEEKFSYNGKSVSQRMFIVAAGPAMNLLFAIVLWAGLFMNGVPELVPVVGSSLPDTPAAIAGFEKGDEIRQVGAKTVKSLSDAQLALAEAALLKESVKVIVSRSGSEKTLMLDLSSISDDSLASRDFLKHIGWASFGPDMPAIIGKVRNDSPASKAGLTEGSRIVSVDGKAIETWDSLLQKVSSSPDKKLNFSWVSKDGQERSATIIPSSEGGKEKVGRIGVSAQKNEAFEQAANRVVSYGFVEAFQKAGEKSYDMTMMTFRMIGGMLSAKVSVSNISGPVSIADYAGKSMDIGVGAFISFMAAISISLFVMNILPVPVLDGGHLVFLSLEGIMRRPVPESWMAFGYKMGAFCLLMLMLTALWNDIGRLV